ncbi:uncharacterized protein B0I36DRAFT_402412 [Microdochium trichocladiopsis]|uniref:Uncharacterized protein n=1 Tax=Microdochium trichocladiopsis TaxID=1682393 RepID=A0A9P9BKD6_9PEZI|nr:uncharacterized protein B0I36DRAFT_402412 [Microdochium trichocladiopsis]KAH7009298.1 hypothetical protein B0I36DRAFT_402412 [Microdochium trichocladiopsis]
MYTYDLARTFPPRSQDVVHHVGWMGLTFSLYWSTMSTNPGITTLMIRNVAACSFFSLGLSGTVQLALLLMERLGPWTRPPLRMARCFRGLVWTLVLSRPMSWAVYIVTYEALWRITATPADFAVMAVLTVAFLGLVDLHTRWSMGLLRKESKLWRNYQNTQLGDSDLEVRTSRAGKMIVLTTYWVVVVAMAIVLLARATVSTFSTEVALLPHVLMSSELHRAMQRDFSQEQCGPPTDMQDAPDFKHVWTSWHAVSGAVYPKVGRQLVQHAAKHVGETVIDR